MKTRQRLQELRLDLTAAAAIGDLDSLHYALDSVRALDDAQLPPAELVNLGILLEAAPTAQLISLAQDPDPAVRALAASGMGGRFLADDSASAKNLDILVVDPHPEVARTLGRRLARFKRTENRGRLLDLLINWLTLESEHADMAALLVLPACHPEPGEMVSALAELDGRTDLEVRSGLVDCLASLAGQAHPQTVLSILAGWADREDPNVWVITRSLSGSWAQSYREAGIAILETLVRQQGRIRPIDRALQRLEFDKPS
jgi:hypothetical protein